ncbi:WD40-repeat-containing domain protein [Cladochytrium replicatum]|nr:WD40-repeat-containing domain protein [Cladochytrium replicatum]
MNGDNSVRDDLHDLLRQNVNLATLTEEEKAELALQLLLSVKTLTLSKVTAKLVPLLHRDFITNLPKELGVQILGLTDVSSVARAARVCKSWTVVALDSSVWRLLFRKYRFKVNRSFLEKCLSQPGLFWARALEKNVMVAAKSVESTLHAPPPIARGPSAVASVTMARSHSGNSVFSGGGTDEGWFGLGVEMRRASIASSYFSASRRNSATNYQLEKDASSSVPPPMTLSPSASSNMVLIGTDSGFLDRVSLYASGNLVGSPSLDLASGSGTPSDKQGLLQWMGIRRGSSQNESGSYPSGTASPLSLSASVASIQFDTLPTELDWRYILKQGIELHQNWTDGRFKAKELAGHDDAVYCLQFDNDKIVSGSRDETIRIWDTNTGALRRILAGHTSSVLCLQYSDNTLISGSSDATLIQWDLATSRVVRTLHGHTDNVLSVGFDDRHIVSCSKDRTVRIWKRRNGESVGTLKGHRGAVNSLQFKRGIVVSAAGDRTIKLWSIETGQQMRTLQSHTGAVASVHYDPSTHLVVSGASDNTVKVWDTRIGECTGTLSGHSSVVRVVQSDGVHRIVSGSYDRTVRVWDLRTGKCWSELDGRNGGHKEKVFALGLDETRVVSCSEDKRIVVWDFSHAVDERFFV